MGDARRAAQQWGKKTLCDPCRTHDEINRVALEIGIGKGTLHHRLARKLPMSQILKPMMHRASRGLRPKIEKFSAT
jgi:hypothetical protein